MFTNPRQAIASFNSGAVGSHLRNWAAKQPLRCPVATSPGSVRASSSSSAFRQNRKTDTDDPSPRGIGWPIGSPTTKTSFDPFPFTSAGSLASPSSSIAPSPASPLSPTLAAFIIARTSLKEFINFAEAEVKSLASSYFEVGRKVDALITYFGEDLARCSSEQDSAVLKNMGEGLGHSLLAYKSILQGIGNQQMLLEGILILSGSSWKRITKKLLAKKQSNFPSVHCLNVVLIGLIRLIRVIHKNSLMR